MMKGILLLFLIFLHHRDILDAVYFSSPSTDNIHTHTHTQSREDPLEGWALIFKAQRESLQTDSAAAGLPSGRLHPSCLLAQVT